MTLLMWSLPASVPVTYTSPRHSMPNVIENALMIDLRCEKSGSSDPEQAIMAIHFGRGVSGASQ